MTRTAFLRLSPRARGYAVYWFGDRDDEPNVPKEHNPYRAGSREATEWDEGARRACLDAQDSEE